MTPGKIGVSINTHVFSGKPEDFSNWEFLFESLAAQAGWSDLIADAAKSVTDARFTTFGAHKVKLHQSPMGNFSKIEESISAIKDDGEEHDPKSPKPTPTDTSTDPAIAAQAAYEQRDRAFYFQLVGSLRGDAVREAKKSKLHKGTIIWALLLKKYKTINASRKTALYGKYFHNENHMKESESIDVYLARLEDQQRQLEDLEVELSEEAIMNVMKNGLTDDFSAVIQIINMSEGISLDKAIEWIREAGRDIESRKQRAS